MAREFIAILDFGGQPTSVAARMIRSAKVYCEIFPHNTPAEEIKAKGPKGIVAVGGAQNADDSDSAAFDTQLLELGVPVLALGYAARALCVAEGGRLDGIAISGQLKDLKMSGTHLFDGLDSGTWYIQRADRMLLPDGYTVLSAVDGVVVAMKRDGLEAYALQIIPEQNDLDCVRLVSNFVLGVCGCGATWTMQAFVDETVESIRATVGSGTALISMSGGVDSSVCAALAHKAIGDRLGCVMIDTGLLRKNEAENIRALFKEKMGMDIRVSDMSQRFCETLTGIIDPKEKRRAIEREMREAIIHEARAMGNADFFVSGTIYRDVVEQRSTLTMAKHILEAGSFKRVIEPLRGLFKDEVRAVGEILGLPQEIIKRQPFPAPGLAIRCTGEVTAQKLEIAREADAIFREEMESAGLVKSVWQSFVILSDMIHDVPGSGYQKYVAVLRAVHTADMAHSSIVRLPYELLISVTERITREIPGVARVVYDLTGKPPAAVEWE